MKKLFILFIFFTIDISSQECSEFFLIRHAEKDRTDPKNKNPNLNEKGKLRALKWTEVFKNIEFDKIYSTNYYRTLETVMPISKKIKKEILIYSPSKIKYDRFISDNNNNKVLIVGHSNTIPSFVNILIKKELYDQIDDRNNSNLYIVKICNNSISHNLLYIK
tara:strand:+ start:919 stop:1407 length:489 start_codon:yes stop_codon:yes gene_type:complete